VRATLLLVLAGFAVIILSVIRNVVAGWIGLSAADSGISTDLFIFGVILILLAVFASAFMDYADE
jgi:uncharacterized membrane protein